MSTKLGSARLGNGVTQPEDRNFDRRVETERKDGLPVLLTAGEAGGVLRTSRKAVYAMIERGQLPGVTRIGRRLLIRSDELLDFLDHSRTPSWR